MIAPAQFIDLALACAAIIVVPGPSVMFVVGRALSHGRRCALASVLGNSVGCYAAAAGIAFGLGPALERSDPLFAALKWTGAAYLVWLGLQTLRRARVPAGPVVTSALRASPWRSFRTGVVVGLTNPKAIIIFAAILPPFVERGDGHLSAQMLQLALAPILLGLFTDTAWATAAGTARRRLAGSPRRMLAIGRLGGVSTIGLGLWLAASGDRR